MELLKWTTVSSWVDETLELFSYIDDSIDIDELSRKVEEGEIYGDRKVNSARRVFQAIKARYLNNDQDEIIALSQVLNSNISYQEKCNYLFIFYLEYETLARLFMGGYVYGNFNNYRQKIFTKMDLDKFFEIVFNEYREKLPGKIKQGVTESSMVKVRNTLYKNIGYFGWIDSIEGKLTIKRPKLTPEWFVFTLYLYFEDEYIDAKEVYNSEIYKRFLLNEFDIEYLIAGAKIRGLIDTNKLGDIFTITKHEKGLREYARNYK